MIIVKFNPTTFIAICSFWLNVVFPFAPTGFWRRSRSNGITIMWRVASRGSAAPRFWRLCTESTSSREERSLISQVSTFLHIMMIFFLLPYIFFNPVIIPFGIILISDTIFLWQRLHLALIKAVCWKDDQKNWDSWFWPDIKSKRSQAHLIAH